MSRPTSVTIAVKFGKKIRDKKHGGGGLGTKFDDYIYNPSLLQKYKIKKVKL